MGIRLRLYNWLREFLSIDALTHQVRQVEASHAREVKAMRAEIDALTSELDTFKAALKKAAERAPQRQAPPTDFDSAQIAALEEFTKENA